MIIIPSLFCFYLFTVSEGHIQSLATCTWNPGIVSEGHLGIFSTRTFTDCPACAVSRHFGLSVYSFIALHLLFFLIVYLQKWLQDGKTKSCSILWKCKCHDHH